MPLFEYLPSCLSLLLCVVDHSSVAGGCAVELIARATICCWRLPRGADYSRRPVFVAGSCSVELIARETVCLKTGIAPLLPSQYCQLYLFRSAWVCATNTSRASASIGLFCFRSIVVSLNAIHHFQLHRNGIHFRLNRTERNGNVTVFMPPTVTGYQVTSGYMQVSPEKSAINIHWW